MKYLFCFFAAITLIALPACQSHRQPLGPMESAEGGPMKGDGKKGSTFIPSTR
jgi:hypothetical protein